MAAAPRVRDRLLAIAGAPGVPPAPAAAPLRRRVCGDGGSASAAADRAQLAAALKNSAPGPAADYTWDFTFHVPIAK